MRPAMLKIVWGTMWASLGLDASRCLFVSWVLSDSPVVTARS
jgi:hypothetical protein